MPSYSKRVEIPGKSSQELYDRVCVDIEKFTDKAAALGKFDIQRDPAAKQVHVKSSMVSATLICTDGSLQFDWKLGLMATPFRSKIEEGIDRWLQKAFNVASKA